mgnify:CR=1 FL=1
MVITIDRKIGILTYWIKGTDHVLAIRDDRLCTGDVVPVFVHRKEESWVKLKRQPEPTPEELEEEEVRSGTGTYKSSKSKIKSKAEAEEEDD